MNYISSNIKHLRKNNRWTQQELANRLGKAKSTIACYETDTRTPNTSDIKAFCNLFHVSMDDFVSKDLSIIDTDMYAEYIKVELSRYKLTDADFNNMERFIHAYYKMNDNQRNRLIQMIESMVE